MEYGMATETHRCGARCQRHGMWVAHRAAVWEAQWRHRGTFNKQVGAQASERQGQVVASTVAKRKAEEMLPEWCQRMLSVKL